MDRQAEWSALAERAIAKFAAVDHGGEQAFGYAYTLGAIAKLHGWDDPRVITYLTKLYSLANPDGGYGLGFAYDQNGDGSVNPATTSYTVTMAGHVGPVLLEGYQAGAVPLDKVKILVQLIMSTGRIDRSTGRCIAYSRAAADAVEPHCVHNVSAGAGAFLAAALAAGVGVSGQARMILEITRREVYSYDPNLMWWHYRDTPSWNDVDHNSYDAESMYELAPWIGREAAWNHMTRSSFPEIPGVDTDADPIAHMRLTSLPARPGAPDWCALGDQWIGEANAFLDDPAPVVGGFAGTRPAQVAYYAAKAAQACA